MQTKELLEFLKYEKVEYKAIENICTISRGKVISKTYITNNAGNYPVYSSQTENEGMLGKISSYDYDGEYVTWTTDGVYAGSVFYRYGKFSVTNVCGILQVKEKNINTKFISYILGITTKKFVNKSIGNSKLMSNVMAKIQIPLPPLEVQNAIVAILDKFTELEKELEKEL
ncbi:restriction endonuclease subunit S, partial [Helicobacter turcicus]